MGSVRPMSRAADERPTDWPVQVAGTIESVVGAVRDKTTVPVETVARALVYGVLIAVMGTTAFVLVTIAGVRLLDGVLRIWAVYVIFGGLFCALGALSWAYRRPRKRG